MTVARCRSGVSVSPLPPETSDVGDGWRTRFVGSASLGARICVQGAASLRERFSSRPSSCRTLACVGLASNSSTSSAKSSCLLVRTCLCKNTGPGRINQAGRDFPLGDFRQKDEETIHGAWRQWQCTTVSAWHAKYRSTQFPNIPQANRASFNTILSFSTNRHYNAWLGRYHAEDRVWSDYSPHLAVASSCDVNDLLKSEWA